MIISYFFTNSFVEVGIWASFSEKVSGIFYNVIVLGKKLILGTGLPYLAN